MRTIELKQKIRMNILDLLRNGTNITLSISVDDLREWHKEVINDTKQRLEDAIASEKQESYLGAQQVCDMLGMNMTTLWRWENKGYLVPAKVGGKRRFKYSEVKNILERGLIK